MKQKATLFTLLFFICFAMSGIAANNNKSSNKKKKQNESLEQLISKRNDIRLKNKIVPLSNPVYSVIEYFETSGKTKFLPLAKPYKKIFIVDLFIELVNNSGLTEKEKKVVQQNLADLTADSNSLEILKGNGDNTFVLVGMGAESAFRKGFGENSSWSTTNLVQPFFSGDVGKNITFTAGIAGGIEQLSPDMFYQSYTKNGKVNFPFENYGYSYLPYQFTYNTNYIHYNRGGSASVDDKLQLALFYNTELNSSWLNGKVQVSINNQHRSWGHQSKNLLLSATARRFPGLEFQINPVRWFRYSFLVGSLFHLPGGNANYKKSIYEEDLGRSQKNYTSHLLEFSPLSWLQITGAANAIWSKRFELSYMFPLIAPSLVQDEVGDHDNPTLYFDIATKFPGFGKAWLGFYVDDFSFTDSWQMLKYVTNKYAWQMGWKTNLLSDLIPGTSSTLSYTRVTPFVYTHYPETDLNLGNDRPIDMTYTHDGFNLGFYLPPNSGELSWSLSNVAIPNLVLQLDNRLIIHGTNDLGSDNIYQIYGDIYQHHDGNINNYPMLDFTNDGIYDWSFQSEFKFDWKIRTDKNPNYYRLTGSLGYSKTWWEANQSGVTPPANHTLLTGSLGLIIEM